MSFCYAAPYTARELVEAVAQTTVATLLALQS
jgi:hypothetical protein